jgi:AraC-like DNA-binding protein
VLFPRNLLTGVYNALPDAAEALITETVMLQRQVSCGDPLQPGLENILCDISKICVSDAPCAKLELHSELLRLIAYILNNELYTYEKTEHPFIPTVLYKTIQYLDGNLYTDISSTDAARHLGYTNAYFCRMFKKYFGTTFTSYLHDTRIAEAQKRIMRDPNILISELSEGLGFNDPNYFSYLFRKSAGVAPSVFAKKYKAK